MIRIVKMTFKESSVSDFLEMFAAKKQAIGSFPGCSGVKLLQDRDNAGIFFTYSRWSGPEALENYRQSELFQTTWKQTKTWFADKPQAWSVEEKEASHAGTI